MKNFNILAVIIVITAGFFSGLRGQIKSIDPVKSYYDQLQSEVSRENDLEKKESILAMGLRNAPDGKYAAYFRDMIYYSIAFGYANKNNVQKVFEYCDKQSYPISVAENRSKLAGILGRQGSLAAAEKLLREAVEICATFRDAQLNDYPRFSAAMGYPDYCSEYAAILHKNGKNKLALQYISIAHSLIRPVRGSVNTTYVKVLAGMGRYKEALDIVDETLSSGQHTAWIRTTAKDIYIKAKGSEEGYRNFIERAALSLVDVTRAELSKQMISETAPDFTLKDLEGKTVSLSALRGKTIVLDFWATWCGPCKASFPAMKMAVEKYRNDSTVKFLFIHTMEYGEAATAEAKKYIADTGYPFEVLMDLKRPGTKTNPVVELFKTSMIPAKFVIDRNGKLRFRMIGYHEGDEATLQQVTAMIELARS